VYVSHVQRCHGVQEAHLNSENFYSKEKSVYYAKKKKKFKGREKEKEDKPAKLRKS
jgi:hypothetical protein